MLNKIIRLMNGEQLNQIISPVMNYFLCYFEWSEETVPHEWLLWIHQYSQKPPKLKWNFYLPVRTEISIDCVGYFQIENCSTTSLRSRLKPRWLTAPRNSSIPSHVIHPKRQFNITIISLLINLPDFIAKGFVALTMKFESNFCSLGADYRMTFRITVRRFTYVKRTATLHAKLSWEEQHLNSVDILKAEFKNADYNQPRRW